ncbi:MAG: PEP-CTERM sorting domain-containing protein [Verrucomicrobiota bacterium]
MNTKAYPLTMAALTAGLLFSPLSAVAASGTWTSTNGGDWSNTANWSSATVASGVDAVGTFSASGTQPINLDTDISVGSLAFSTGTYTIASGNGSVLTLATSTTVAPTILGTATISAVIDGTQGFTYTSGNRKLTLSGANIYTGVTTLTNGNLTVTSNDALGASGEGNGTVVSQASGQFPQFHIANNVTLAEDLTLRMNWYNVANNGSVVGGNLVYNDSGDNVINGTITLDRAAGSNANVVHLMGIQTGTGSLTLNGDISGSASGGQASGTYADPTRLQFRTTTAAAYLNVNGNISDGTVGTGGLSVYTSDNSSGIVRLTGANTYSGSTVHQTGTLLINNTAGSGTGTGSVSVSTGAIFGGNGIIKPTGANGVVFASGAVVAPGDLTEAGSAIAAGEALTFDLSETTGNVVFSTGVTMSFNLNAAAETPDLVSESLAFTGLSTGVAQVEFNDNVLNFSLTGGLLADGLYTIASFDAANAYSGQVVIGTGLEAYDVKELIFNAGSIQLAIGNVIPEPSAAGLLAGLAVLGLGLSRRRRA